MTGMATFPSAAILIRALRRDFGMESLPAHLMSSRKGLYVANGMTGVSGPTVMVRLSPSLDREVEVAGNAQAAGEIRALLVFAGYQVRPARSGKDTEVRVDFVPSKQQAHA